MIEHIAYIKRLSESNEPDTLQKLKVCLSKIADAIQVKKNLKSE